MAGSVSIARLGEDQIELAADMLARFLNDQPIASIFGNDEQQRMARFRAGYEPLLRYCCAHGYPQVAMAQGKLLGIALWMPPHGPRATPEEEKEFGLDLMPETFGEPVVRLRPLGNLLRDLHMRDMPVPHWFLAMLVVDHAQQSKGIGGELLRPILQRADEGGLQCYADTIQLGLVTFFHHHGFKILADGIEPETRIQYWTLRREPAPVPTSEG
jgi:GNAT superfamily N-acetyltransferase